MVNTPLWGRCTGACFYVEAATIAADAAAVVALLNLFRHLYLFFLTQGANEHENRTP